VFFDFDGTLSEIVDDPASARLAAGAGHALASLAARCPLAVLSGRDLADVRQRVSVAGLWYAGSHGFELTGPDGAHQDNEAATAAVPVLADAATALRHRLESVAGVAVEHKRFAVAMHYRNAARDHVGAVAGAVRDAGRQYALRVTTGREVIELRPDIDWDKGKTLRWILDQVNRSGHGGPLVPIYLGDDITDEDAFDAISHDGVGIVVRHTDDGDRATAARFALDNPEQVCEFTKRLARQLDSS
jgi:trehalose 6-phosphate phosphatase